MYNVSTKFNELAFAMSREVTAKVKINGKTYQDEIISFKLTESVTSEQTIGIGEACASSLSLKMKFHAEISLPGAEVFLYLTFDGEEWCPLGSFFVSDVETSDNYMTVDVTAYDQMAFLTDKYAGTGTTCAEVMSYISQKYSFVIEETSYPTDAVITNVDCTCREMIGYVAGLMGTNARFNRDGNLEFRWYSEDSVRYGDANLDGAIDAKDIAYINQNLLGSASTTEAEAILGRMIVGKAYIGAKITDILRGKVADVNLDGIVNSLDVAEIQSYIGGTPYDPTLVNEAVFPQSLTDSEIYMGGQSKKADYTITCLISGVQDNTFTSGTGRSISFSNPFINQEILDRIAAEILPFSYHAGTVKYRGNPAYECCDIVRISDRDFPIMEQIFEFDGGLSATISSYGLSDEEIKMTVKTNDLDRQVNAIEKALQEINNSLLSGEAGYMILDEEEIDGIKRLSGFKLMNTPTINSTTKGWLANKNGIGWSDDGFKTISKLGLDMANGKIYADQIAAGAIITNSFQIGDAMSFNGTTGEITFGSKVKMSWASIEDQPDIPTNLSDLNNDEGFINSTAATVITNNAISTATIRADQVLAGSFTMTGGSIKVSASDSTSVIKLIGSSFYSHLKPDGLEMGWNNSSRLSYVTANAFYLASGTNQTNITAGVIYLNNSRVATISDLSGYYSSGDNIYANRLYVQGAGNISGDPNARLAASSPYQLGYASGSSRAFKRDIKPVENSELNPEKLYGIEVVQFKYNDDYLDENDQRYGIDCIGFIAEQVNEVYPIAADCETGSPRNWEMRYIIPPMLALIQQQKKEIDKLKEQVGRLLS